MVSAKQPHSKSEGDSSAAANTTAGDQNRPLEEWTIEELKAILMSNFSYEEYDFDGTETHADMLKEVKGWIDPPSDDESDDE